jgi:hypothetical protein
MKVLCDCFQNKKEENKRIPLILKSPCLSPESFKWFLTDLAGLLACSLFIAFPLRFRNSG